MEKFRKRIFTSFITLSLIGGIGLSICLNQMNNTPTLNKQGSLAMYIEDENGNYQLSSSKKFPKEGYVLNLEKSSCKNGGVLSQNKDTKGINLSISQNDVCNLYFEKEKLPLLDTIMNKRNDDTITVYTDGMTGEMYTFDHEEAAQTTRWSESERRDYRYIGSSPNNWVKFNGEDWRIIGVFTVETSSGTKEQLIKIIRNESIGDIVWNSDKINEWSSSSLKMLLNGDYYNTESSFSYTFIDYSNSSQTVTIPKGLNKKARDQIEEVKWYLGGSKAWKNLGGPDYYNLERGETTCVTTGYCSDETRSINTFAKVGLMYPSDHIYTYANGVDSICYTDGYNCKTGQKVNGWLYSNLFQQWTLSSLAGFKDCVFGALISGTTVGIFVYDSYSVRPSVYLKSSVKITGGDGTQGNAYILE